MDNGMKKVVFYEVFDEEREALEAVLSVFFIPSLNTSLIQSGTIHLSL